MAALSSVKYRWNPQVSEQTQNGATKSATSFISLSLICHDRLTIMQLFCNLFRLNLNRHQELTGGAIEFACDGTNFEIVIPEVIRMERWTFIPLTTTKTILMIAIIFDR